MFHVNVCETLLFVMYVYLYAVYSCVVYADQQSHSCSVLCMYIRIPRLYRYTTILSSITFSYSHLKYCIDIH